MSNAAEVEAVEEEPQAPESLLPESPATTQAAEEANVDMPHLVNDDGVVAEDEHPEDDFNRPDRLQEQFWDEENGPDVEKLSNSYNNLRKQFRQGRHKVPEEYDLSLLTEAGVPSDDPIVSLYTDWAKEFGISQHAFEQLAAGFVESGMTQATEQLRSIDEEKRALGPEADALIASTSTWLGGLVEKGLLSQDDYEEARVMAGTAGGIRVFQKIRRFYGDNVAPLQASTDDMPSKEELNEMVGDPRFQSDPSYRRNVEKMFNKLYGNTASEGSNSISAPLFGTAG